MNYRDQQELNFNEHGERSNVITDIEEREAEKVESLFDDLPHGDDLDEVCAQFLRECGQC